MSGDELGRPRTTPQPSATTQLSLDQAYQQLFAGSPDNFYKQAQLVDATVVSLQDDLDKFANQLRNVEEVWSGAGADSYGEIAGELSGYIGGLLWTLRNPDYAALLRQAGDALASAQQRIADLKTQRDKDIAANPANAASDQVRYDYLAQQVMQSVYDSYVQVGDQIGNLPAYTAKGNPVRLLSRVAPMSPNDIASGPVLSTLPVQAVAMPTGIDTNESVKTASAWSISASSGPPLSTSGAAVLGRTSVVVPTGMSWVPTNTGGAVTVSGPTSLVATGFEHIGFEPSALGATSLGSTASTALGSTSLVPTSARLASAHRAEAVAGSRWVVTGDAVGGVVGSPKAAAAQQKETAGTSDCSNRKANSKSVTRSVVQDTAIPSDGVLRSDNAVLVADTTPTPVDAVAHAAVAHAAVAHAAVAHPGVAGTPASATSVEVPVSTSSGTIAPHVVAHAVTAVPVTSATPTDAPVSTSSGTTTSHVTSHVSAGTAPHAADHVTAPTSAKAAVHSVSPTPSPTPSSSPNTLAPTTVTTPTRTAAMQTGLAGPRLGESPVASVESSINLPTGVNAVPATAQAPFSPTVDISDTKMSTVDNSVVSPVVGNQAAPAGSTGRSMMPMQAMGGRPQMVPGARSRMPFVPADPGVWHVDDGTPYAVGRHPQFTPQEGQQDD